MAYHDTKGDPYEKPYGSLINHLFLHQIHHRGQVSTLLSQFGMDFGDTDIIEIIE
ncbi:MAG: DinB family protein [Thiolinea sp.]